MPQLHITLLIFAAVFGAIIGSFLNALSFRFNTGRRFFKSMGGRSRCMHCGHQLGAADLIPVFSFIFLRGKCRYCGSKISWQYALVELAAALLSVLVLVAHPSPASYAFWFVVWMLLLFIVVYDTRQKIIPTSCSAMLAAFALIYLVEGHHLDILSLIAGPALASPLFFISLVSGGRWMGWGDSALELSLGWFLGPTLGLTALMLGFWSGALAGIGIILYQRLPRRAKQSVTMSMQSEIPFAPFLILGAALAYFLHVDFFSSLYTLF